MTLASLRPHTLGLATALLGFSSLSGHAFAQNAPQNAPASQTSISAGYVGMSEADLDAGGTASVDSAILSINHTRNLARGSSLGLQFRAEQDNWKFDGNNRFGGSPWGDIQRYSIGVPFMTPLNNDWRLMVTPRAEWAMEDGADEGEALTWGLTVGAMRSYGANRRLGVGLATFAGLDDEVKVFPFFIVDWRFNEQWRLFNPLGVGPSGPAGLELAYRFNDKWELGLGGSWRSSEFRLSTDNRLARNGIGEVNYIPVFMHVSWKPTPMIGVDAYAGMAFGGELKVLNANGDDIRKDDLGSAPIFGVTGSLRF
ncbi:MAG: DUF6268 family outer membrane beta-barrel protein [Moraxellaceae bacterium]|nr:DUF6268 family outer membrane beta-barrel protein [Moraxellaceae bacterium]